MSTSISTTPEPPTLSERIRAVESVPVPRKGRKSTALSDSLVHNLGAHECWPWQGTVLSNGYGRARIPGPQEKYTSAHRYVWTLFHGQVASGLQVDHLCHDPGVCHGVEQCPHRKCVNPAHLEVVTPRENTMRSGSPSAKNAVRTHCANGHPFSTGNTYIDPRGYRQCRTCRIERGRIYDKRRGWRRGSERLEITHD